MPSLRQLERDGISLSTREMNRGWLSSYPENFPNVRTPVCGLVIPGGLCALPAQHDGRCRP